MRLTPNERSSLINALLYIPKYCEFTRHTINNLLGRTLPNSSRYRYVVHCSTERRTWDKVFYDVDLARDYAGHACYKWCAKSNVKIIRQRWIAL